MLPRGAGGLPGPGGAQQRALSALRERGTCDPGQARAGERSDTYWRIARHAVTPKA